MISGRHSGRLALISGEQRDNFGTKMVPVYAARIEELGPGDFVKVDCTACSHRALLALVFLDRLGLDLTINGQNVTDGTLKKLEFLRVSASVGWIRAGHSAILQGLLPCVPDYRRNRVPGGSFFFTVNLLDRRSGLLVMQIQAFRDAVRQVRLHAPFRIDAWVVLRDHMHCLWTLPAGDADLPGRWRAIKMAFSKALPAREPRSPAMTSRGQRRIWQRRYWEHTIRDDRDFAAHLDYTHFNRVKHGLVEHPADWLHSSVRCKRGGKRKDTQRLEDGGIQRRWWR